MGYLSYGQVDDIVDTFDYVNGESEVSKLDFLEYWALTFGFWRPPRIEAYVLKAHHLTMPARSRICSLSINKKSGRVGYPYMHIVSLDKVSNVKFSAHTRWWGKAGWGNVTHTLLESHTEKSVVE